MSKQLHGSQSIYCGTIIVVSMVGGGALITVCYIGRVYTDADPTHSCILSVGMSAGIYSALPDILQFSMYKIK